MPTVVDSSAIKRALSEFVEKQTEKLIREVQEEVNRQVREAIAKRFDLGSFGVTETVVPAAKTEKRGPGRPPLFGEQRCRVKGCKKEYRSKGYCATHYQKALKYNWPRPAPKNFAPPPTERKPRGRKPKQPVMPIQTTEQATPTDTTRTRSYEVTA